MVKKEDEVAVERATQLLQETDARLRKVTEQVEAITSDLALEIGRNLKWQAMFEDIGQASVTISVWVKKTYLTKTINVQELEMIYTLADRIENAMFAYQKRKDLVNQGVIKEEEVNDERR